MSCFRHLCKVTRHIIFFPCRLYPPTRMVSYRVICVQMSTAADSKEILYQRTLKGENAMKTNATGPGDPIVRGDLLTELVIIATS
jgi:hypothetical protein